MFYLADRALPNGTPGPTVIDRLPAEAKKTGQLVCYITLTTQLLRTIQPGLAHGRFKHILPYGVVWPGTASAWRKWPRDRGPRSVGRIKPPATFVAFAHQPSLFQYPEML